MYIAHVLIFPVLIGLLLGAHLLLVAMRHHTQFRRRKAQTEHTIVGVPAWPGQAPRSLGLMAGTAGILFLLGGLVQINPIWLWGPYHTYSSTNGAQPDWYLGWLIGGLRLVPSFDLSIGHYTLVPNPFWGGAAFPLLVFGFLYLWPWLERRDRQLGLPRLPGGRLGPRLRHVRDRLCLPDPGLLGRHLGAAGAVRTHRLVDL
jgi:ubiquinol-cytochrome c reductase cytochrome b subunit